MATKEGSGTFSSNIEVNIARVRATGIWVVIVLDGEETKLLLEVKQAREMSKALNDMADQAERANSPS
jgi:hypothetical protein